MDLEKQYSKNTKIIIKVSIITIIANALLVAAKMILGLLFDNLSVISDAVHSASDLATSFLIIGAAFISNPKPDKKHNYGHEKVEALVTLVISFVLAALGIILIWEGITGLISPIESELNFYLIGVVVLSLVVKETMFRYEMYYAKKIKSEILRADAWHSRSDSLSSVAVLIGLVANIFIKTNLFESIAVIIVALFIIKVSIDILIPAINQLIEKAASEEVCHKIKETAKQIYGVLAIDNLKTRVFGNSIYTEIEIGVDASLSVEDSHSIAQAVHDALEALEEFHIKHCTVHINPFKGITTDESRI